MKLCQHRLYKDSCDSAPNGREGYVKDLSRFNRDLSKIILMDVGPERSPLYALNVVALGAWDGQVPDTALLDIISVLESESPPFRLPLAACRLSLVLVRSVFVLTVIVAMAMDPNIDVRKLASYAHKLMKMDAERQNIIFAQTDENKRRDVEERVAAGTYFQQQQQLLQ